MIFPMSSSLRAAALYASAAAALVGVVATDADADATQIGLFFGPRTFASDSRLGYLGDASFHPVLNGAIAFGARIARPFFPWLTPELELAIAPTDTTSVGGAAPASVVWLEPRLHLRFDILPGRRFIPFIVVGGGAPVALSAARKTFDSGIIGDGYVGGGVRLDTRKGFAFRLDARVALVPGIDHVIDPEVEVNLGAEFHIGEYHRARRVAIAPPPPDRDGDGIADGQDHCPDRSEDADGFDDLDGCPDIDNDGDLVLDIADKCANVPETYNGFEDDDGCPDTLPPEVDALRGTVEGLLYADGETVVRDSAQPNMDKLAALMTKYPSIRVVLIGHTDDREAKQFATVIEGQPAPDLAALSADLSRARAESVKQALVAAGVKPNRVDVEGHGAEEPVTDNDNPRGRLANRRVEIKLYVPQRR